MFDLDDFGKVNKTYGNLAGDLVLKTAADRMRGALDNKAFAFRRGGEEFVIVLEQDQRSALLLAERVRRAIAQTPVTGQNAKGKFQVEVRASFGVANTFSDGLQPSKLEELSDTRMREAKAAGKDRVQPPLSAELLDWLNTRQFV